jgi:hypothetical protein
MPSYVTPAPIDLAINLPVGAIEVHATDRDDTVVTVTGSNPAKEQDRRGAEETTVEFDGHRLTVVAPKPRIAVFGPTESIDVRVELPSGSRLTAELSTGTLRTTGHLGATRIKNLTGPTELGTVGDLWLRAGHGNVTVAGADGNVEVTADHGQIRIGRVGGDATLKASHGTVTIDEAAGDVDAKLSYGDLEIRSAAGSVAGKTAYGSVQLQEVASGSIQVESGYGQITIGVRQGVPAWLDLASKGGHVRNELDGDSTPAPGERTVAVRARTQYGDIRIRRAQ